MTKPRRHSGRSDGSQASGDAWSSSHAWYVNFNNGNANNNNRDNNNGLVRAVRSLPPGECEGAAAQGVNFRALHAAWKEARRGKAPSRDQLGFDARWAEGLVLLERELRDGTWRPRRSTCFVATRPKAREIHAPHFTDRVVHHWLVPQLEAIWEPRFIHDSYANRRGKGSHAAVQRLERFVRQVASGQGGGWFLQLDIHNFFVSIHRRTLYGLLRPVMRSAGLHIDAQRAVHALLRGPALAAGVHLVGTEAEHAAVPAHKRLANAAPGCGLPVGNLSSQFFANVYLDPLDQLVKRTLRANRYVRYVDDFVLVHHDRAQLEAWWREIEAFLGRELKLSLKPGAMIRPIGDGIDFLGYVIRPTHTLARRRVVAHVREALAGWEAQHVAEGAIHCTPRELEAIKAKLASFRGHLQHARSHRLQRAIARRFPWTAALDVRRRFRPHQLDRPLRLMWAKA